jgi:single-strand DNA-binding protein
VDVVVWDKTAENCEKYLRKGSSILVEGRLQMDEWQSKEGEKRSKLRVRADRVQFTGTPRGSAAAGEREPRPSEEPGEAPAAQPSADAAPEGDTPF